MKNIHEKTKKKGKQEKMHQRKYKVLKMQHNKDKIYRRQKIKLQKNLIKIMQNILP